MRKLSTFLVAALAACLVGCATLEYSIPPAAAATVSAAPSASGFSACTACSIAGIKVGATAYAFKTANTARASTVAKSPDPDLQMTAAPIGWYRVVLFFRPGTASGTAGGISFSIEAGGVTTNTHGYCDVGDSTQAAVQFFYASLATVTPTLLPTLAEAYVRCEANVQLTAAGTIDLTWAQQTSSASATQVYAGSYMTVTRLQ